MKSGDKLGPYELLSPLGEGGMGEVWKARDTRLQRVVAVKVSKADFTERFEREARVVAALNHPNIGTLFDVGPNYLVMEYVDGAELSGPLPLPQALRHGIQLAAALEAAHRKGIVHRDLKPANVLVTKSGLKVLDFGLAKMQEKPTPGVNELTVTSELTRNNAVFGTLQYMPPEQLQGEPTDARSDIFAFGCVLYEVLTGKKAFPGNNQASVIAAIMERQVPVTGAASVDWILQRCLAKDLEERWQSALDLRAALERCLAETGSENSAEQSIASPPRSTPPTLWMAASAVLAVLAAGLAYLHFRSKPAENPLVRFNILPSANVIINSAGELSPDGRRIVFAASAPDGKTQLWVRTLDSLTPTPIAGTEGATFPFWSPDSRSIGFGADEKLKKVDLNGGTPVTLADAPTFRGGTWNRDDVILFSPDRIAVLQRVSAKGGPSTPATDKDKFGGAGHRWPVFLPDGQHFLVASPVRPVSDHARILLGSLNSRELTVLMEADSNARYSDGYLLFLRKTSLTAQKFDLTSLKLSGDLVPVADDVETISTSALGKFSAAENGAISYLTTDLRRTLNWFDRNGNRISANGEPAAILEVTLSPDRTRVATVTSARGHSEVWIYDLARGSRFRLAEDAEGPVWSPDGRRILYLASRGGPSMLYMKSSDGAGAEESIPGVPPGYPLSWSPDGSSILGTRPSPKTGFDVVSWGPNSASTVKALVETPYTEGFPQVSPDGKWFSYESNESGRNEIYVAAFSGPAMKKQVSTTGGQLARWSPNGREIFYVGADKRLYAAEIAARSGSLEVGRPRQTFGQLLIIQGTGGFPYDLSNDGQKLLLPESESLMPQGITVVLNWQAGLRK